MATVDIYNQYRDQGMDDATARAATKQYLIDNGIMKPMEAPAAPAPAPAPTEQPSVLGQKYRELMSGIPGGDIMGNFIRGATWEYAPKIEAPADAGWARKELLDPAAHLAGLAAGLMLPSKFAGALRGIPLVGPAVSGLARTLNAPVKLGGPILSGLATGAKTGAIYGALKNPEPGTSRLEGAQQDAAMFAAFEGAGGALGKMIGQFKPAYFEAANAMKNNMPLTPEQAKAWQVGNWIKALALGGGGGAAQGLQNPNMTPESMAKDIALGMGTFGLSHGLMEGMTGRPKAQRPGAPTETPPPTQGMPTETTPWQGPLQPGPMQGPMDTRYDFRGLQPEGPNYNALNQFFPQSQQELPSTLENLRGNENAFNNQANIMRLKMDKLMSEMQGATPFEADLGWEKLNNWMMRNQANKVVSDTIQSGDQVDLLGGMQDALGNYLQGIPTSPSEPFKRRSLNLMTPEQKTYAGEQSSVNARGMVPTMLDLMQSGSAVNPMNPLVRQMLAMRSGEAIDRIPENLPPPPYNAMLEGVSPEEIAFGRNRIAEIAKMIRGQQQPTAEVPTVTGEPDVQGIPTEQQWNPNLEIGKRFVQERINPKDTRTPVKNVTPTGRNFIQRPDYYPYATPEQATEFTKDFQLQNPAQSRTYNQYLEVVERLKEDPENEALLRRRAALQDTLEKELGVAPPEGERPAYNKEQMRLFEEPAPPAPKVTRPFAEGAEIPTSRKPMKPSEFYRNEEGFISGYVPEYVSEFMNMLEGPELDYAKEYMKTGKETPIPQGLDAEAAKTIGATLDYMRGSERRASERAEAKLEAGKAKQKPYGDTAPIAETPEEMTDKFLAKVEENLSQNAALKAARGTPVKYLMEEMRNPERLDGLYKVLDQIKEAVDSGKMSAADGDKAYNDALEAYEKAVEKDAGIGPAPKVGRNKKEMSADDVLAKMGLAPRGEALPSGTETKAEDALAKMGLKPRTPEPPKTVFAKETEANLNKIIAEPAKPKPVASKAPSADEALAKMGLAPKGEAPKEEAKPLAKMGGESPINRWAKALASSDIGLHPKKVAEGEIGKLIEIAQHLASKGEPADYNKGYKNRNERRQQIIDAARELGIDLASIKLARGVKLNREFLNMISKAEGNVTGTKADLEIRRRELKTKYLNEKQNNPSIVDQFLASTKEPSLTEMNQEVKTVPAEKTADQLRELLLKKKEISEPVEVSEETNAKNINDFISKVKAEFIKTVGSADELSAIMDSRDGRTVEERLRAGEPVSFNTRDYGYEIDPTEGGRIYIHTTKEVTPQFPPRLIPNGEGNQEVGAEAGKQVETTSFQNWFKESKAVDAENKPMVVYHGTNRDFSEFYPGQKSGIIYFSEKPSYASDIAELRFLRNAGNNLKPVFLSVQNPLDLRPMGREWITLKELNEKYLKPNGIRAVRPSINEPMDYDQPAYAWVKKPPVANAIRKAGFDGVRLTEELDYTNQAGEGRTNESDAWVVFDPTQIKSATGNIGTFSPTNKDIRYSIEKPSPILEYHDRIVEPELRRMPDTPHKAYVSAAADLLRASASKTPDLTDILPKIKDLEDLSSRPDLLKAFSNGVDQRTVDRVKKAYDAIDKRTSPLEKKAIRMLVSAMEGRSDFGYSVRAFKEQAEKDNLVIWSRKEGTFVSKRYYSVEPKLRLEDVTTPEQAIAYLQNRVNEIEKGVFTVYHGTSKEIADKIKTEGFQRQGINDIIRQAYEDNGIPWEQRKQIPEEVRKGWIEHEATSRIQIAGGKEEGLQPPLSFAHEKPVADRWGGKGGEIYQEIDKRVREWQAAKEDGVTTADEFYKWLDTEASDRVKYQKAGEPVTIEAKLKLDEQQKRYLDSYKVLLDEINSGEVPRSQIVNSLKALAGSYHDIRVYNPDSVSDVVFDASRNITRESLSDLSSATLEEATKQYNPYDVQEALQRELLGRLTEAKEEERPAIIKSMEETADTLNRAFQNEHVFNSIYDSARVRQAHSFLNKALEGLGIEVNYLAGGIPKDMSNLATVRALKLQGFTDTEINNGDFIRLVKPSGETQFIRDPNGKVTQALINISLADSPDAMRTSAHEAAEVLYRFLNPAEQALVNATFHTNPTNRGLNEMFADAFADYMAKPEPKGILNRVFNKLSQFIGRLKNALNGAGYQTIDDLFSRMASGEIARRGWEAYSPSLDELFYSIENALPRSQMPRDEGLLDRVFGAYHALFPKAENPGINWLRRALAQPRWLWMQEKNKSAFPLFDFSDKSFQLGDSKINNMVIDAKKWLQLDTAKKASLKDFMMEHEGVNVSNDYMKEHGLDGDQINAYWNWRHSFEKAHMDMVRSNIERIMYKFADKPWWEYYLDHWIMNKGFQDTEGGPLSHVKTWEGFSRRATEEYGADAVREMEALNDKEANPSLFANTLMFDGDRVKLDEEGNPVKEKQHLRDTVMSVRKMVKSGLYIPHNFGNGSYYTKIVRVAPDGSEQTEWRQNTDASLDIMQRFQWGKQQKVAQAELAKIQAEYAKEGKTGFEFKIDKGKINDLDLDQFAPKISKVHTHAFLENVLQQMKDTGKLDNAAADAFSEQMLEAVQTHLMAKSATNRHLIPRKMIEDIAGADAYTKGYKTDNLDELMVNYFRTISNTIAKNYFRTRAYPQLLKVEASVPGLKESAYKFVEDMLAPAHSIDRNIGAFKNVIFASYMGLNLRPAAIQLTQNLITGTPILAREISKYKGRESLTTVEAERRMFSAMADVAKGKKALSPDELALMLKLDATGKSSAQFAQNLMYDAMGPTRSAWQKFIHTSGWLFSKAEQFNRQAAALARYRLTRDMVGAADRFEMDDPKFKQAFDDATFFVDNTHYVLGKTNMPAFLQGNTASAATGRALYMFRNFTNNYLESIWHYTMHDTASGGRPQFDVAMRSLAYLAVLGGMAGLPFVDDLLDAAERKTGTPYRDQIRQALGGSKSPLQQGVMGGLPALFGANISGSLSIGVPTGPESLVGVYGGLGDKYTKAFESMTIGDHKRMAENLAPDVIANVLKAHRIATEGATTNKGQVLFDEEGRPVTLNPTEQAVQSLGFKPTNYGYTQGAARTAKNIEQYFLNKKQKINAQARLAIKEPDKLAELNDQIRQFNENAFKKAGGSIRPITGSTIKSAIRPKPDLTMRRLEMEGSPYAKVDSFGTEEEGQ